MGKRGTKTYKTLEVFGPEHEFSIVNDELQVLPIVDKILKDFHGRIVNSVVFPRFAFGKELQTHVIEVRPNEPFKSPIDFEETMQEAVSTLQETIHRKFGANLLGLGMHPLLRLDQTGVWSHRHRQIYEAYSKVFNLRRHGWLNIQSYQLNLPYANEAAGIALHNAIANICAYLPAVSASSPLYEGKFGECVDNRLVFYKLNQKEIPSVTGDVIPERVSSFNQYRTEIIGKYSRDLLASGASGLLIGKEWVNSRAAILRFDRRAVEIRVMDEQECIKSDIALSCFIRALLRAFIKSEEEIVSHDILTKDFNSIIKRGLKAKTLHPEGGNAREVCLHFLKKAMQNATEEEKKYIPLVQKRIAHGNLSEIIHERIQRRMQKTDFSEALRAVYSKLIRSLTDNQPYM